VEEAFGRRSFARVVNVYDCHTLKEFCKVQQQQQQQNLPYLAVG
jgi:hypothetical protein